MNTLDNQLGQAAQMGQSAQLEINQQPGRAQVRAHLQQLLQNNPNLQQAIDQGMGEIRNDPDMTPENIQYVINILEQVLLEPAQYPQMRHALLQLGVDELPEQYDPIVIGVLLIVLYQAVGKTFARGGLAQVAERLRKEGRDGDTVLAHISPFEASILRQYGGSGSINPVTGLPEYKFWNKIKKLLKVAVPVALMFVPGLNVMVGSALGASGAMAGVVGGAVVGGATAALTGGDPLKGALFGGLGAGAGQMLGGAANNAMNLGLGQTGQAILGSTLAGAGIGALTGEGAAKGAMQGLAGGTLGQAVSGLAGTGTGAIAEGIRAAGNTMGNLTTMGAAPQHVLTGGAVAGLAGGFMSGKPLSSSETKPSMTPAQKSTLDQQLQDGTITRAEYSRQAGVSDAQMGPTGPIVSDEQAAANLKALNAKYTGEVASGVDKHFAAEAIGSGSGFAPEYAVAPPALPVGAPSIVTPQSVAPVVAPTATPPSTGAFGTDIGLNMKTLGAGMALLGLSGAQTPEQVQEAVATSNMTDAQKAYFGRQTRFWNWDELQTRASTNKQGLGEYLAKNWNTVAEESAYQGDTSDEVKTLCGGGRVKKMATGGPLTRLAQGGGSGRDDTIMARLSDGEYVIDAETVALLGDGSIDEGARRLDAFRSNVRKQKGKALARGKISPNAKSPLAYLKGAM